MTPTLTSDDTVWLSPPQLAKDFNKAHSTIFRWCSSGFILTLGYRLRRTPKGQYLIGIPRQEYIASIADSLTQSPPL